MRVKSSTDPLRVLVSIAILGAVTSAGCPRTVSPVDASQALLVEAGVALAMVDSVVARMAAVAGQEARWAVETELSLGCPSDDEECPNALELYREYMTTWTELVEAVRDTADALQTWESANDAWRLLGRRPNNWNAVVCEPVETSLARVSSLMAELRLPAPEEFRRVSLQTADLCSHGVVVAEEVVQP